ncbi:UNVERIFIED_CONTAM: hypothetical protein FKN15_063749 [Acipenser sinensis]
MQQPKKCKLLQQQPSLEDPASLFPWCSWCGKVDHRWRSCPEVPPADWCGRCEKDGHNWAGCPYNQAQEEVQFSPRASGATPLPQVPPPSPPSQEIWDWLMHPEADLFHDLPIAINTLWRRDGGGLCAAPSCHTRKYHLVQTKKNWTEARSYCREKHTDLVTVHSLEEQQQILNIVKNETSDFKKETNNRFWIGLYWDSENWQWSTGDAVRYTNWTAGTDRLFCATANAGGSWGQSVCHDQKPFMCYNETSHSSERDHSEAIRNENCTMMYHTQGQWRDAPCSQRYFFFCYEEYNPTITALQTVPLSCLNQPCLSGQDCITDSCVDPCQQYNVLDEPWRSTHFPVSSSSVPKCDRDLNGWYRFLVNESVRMPEACVPEYSCGTHVPMWINGTHPLETDGIVSHQSCGKWSSSCCYFTTTVHIKACPGNYHVYKFQGTPGCNLAYCAGTEIRIAATLLTNAK